ncbi:hypothetical protein B566_EDAN014743 [Ephemera danica]|nr:hypothetical protein B566_EDAN014743 [Ephemera danica]
MFNTPQEEAVRMFTSTNSMPNFVPFINSNEGDLSEVPYPNKKEQPAPLKTGLHIQSSEILGKK